MADLDYSDYRDVSGAPVGVTVASLMNWAGAVMSLALIAGLVVWGYQLMVRDVTGVPVVRALEGPMRIAPEDPGGERASFQGLAVNRIAAEGTAADAPDRVVLAPPAPGLLEEDQAMAALLPDAPQEPLPEPAANVSAIDLAVAAALGEDVSVILASASASDVPAPTPAALSTGDDAQGDGLFRSPRPAPRPDTRVASLAPAAALASGGIDADPASIAPGARLVQLGAFPTADEARAEWDRVAERFGDFMAGKRRVIQEAEAGGRNFFRLRVLGFEDLSDSRRFCAALVAGEANCIPVAWR
jgi:hypothetical protein